MQRGANDNANTGHVINFKLTATHLEAAKYTVCMRFFTYLLGVTGLFILSLPSCCFSPLLVEQPDSALNTQLQSAKLEDIQGIVLNNGPGLLGGSETYLIELNEQESNALLTYLIRQGLNADNQWLEGLGARLDLST